MNKVIAATAGAAAIGLGALTVGSLLPVGAVEAQDEEAAPHESDGPWVGRPRILSDALEDLVADGTLTQEQADAVTAAVQERIDELPDRPGPGRPGHPGFRLLRHGLETAAESIGVEVGALREALRDGQSIVEVAEANGVDPQTVVDDLVAAGNEAVDEAVANGRIDDDRAAEIRENLPEWAETFVNPQSRAPFSRLISRPAARDQLQKPRNGRRSGARPPGGLAA